MYWMCVHVCVCVCCLWRFPDSLPLKSLKETMLTLCCVLIAQLVVGVFFACVCLCLCLWPWSSCPFRRVKRFLGFLIIPCRLYFTLHLDYRRRIIRPSFAGATVSGSHHRWLLVITTCINNKWGTFDVYTHVDVYKKWRNWELCEHETKALWSLSGCRDLRCSGSNVLICSWTRWEPDGKPFLTLPMLLNQCWMIKVELSCYYNQPQSDQIYSLYIYLYL